jgi:amino acid adenylation domain-containing protein
LLLVALADCNQTEADYPRNSTIAELFELQAAKTPDATAVIAAEHRLTYRELDERSNRLARHLQSCGVKPETLVGVAMDRSEALVIGLLAILKAGGAYVPLDPSHPKERLSLVINDSAVSVILTTGQVRGKLPLCGSRLVVVDDESSVIDFHSTCTVKSGAAGHNLAYVIYTSGSTGKPKGVMVENRNVVNFFTGMDRAIGCAGGVWLAVTSVSFDISVLELLWTLTRGFQVVIHRDQLTNTIADEIAAYGVTHLQMTPSLARILLLDSRSSASLGSLRQLLLGGEAVPPSLVTRLRQVFRGEIHNMYGPTETTIWSTTYPVVEAGATIAIGRPIANTQIHLLDTELQPVADGAIGELFIGGDGVARGYWNRPELTAVRFVVAPFLPGKRLYRTGDLARYLPDGIIEFLGRADFQIKLRGFRIESSEIETILEQCPGVRHAAVVLREDREGDKRLVAYLVSEASGAEASRTLRNTLEAKLPEYMVPSTFAFLKELPLTANGKLDRKSLLEIPPPSPSADVIGNAPESEIERIIAGVWQDALGITAVGTDDNFFDLGAHSLIVAEVQAKLQEVLGREIGLVDLFQFPTVRALAGHLEGAQQLGPTSDRARRRRAAALR